MVLQEVDRGRRRAEEGETQVGWLHPYHPRLHVQRPLAIAGHDLGVDLHRLPRSKTLPHAAASRRQALDKQTTLAEIANDTSAGRRRTDADASAQFDMETLITPTICRVRHPDHLPGCSIRY